MRRKNNIKENCNVDTLNPDSCDPVVLLPFFGVRHIFYTPKRAPLNSADKSRELRRTRRTDTRRGLLEKEKNEWIRKANASERVLLSFSLSFFSFARAPKMTINRPPRGLPTKSQSVGWKRGAYERRLLSHTGLSR